MYSVGNVNPEWESTISITSNQVEFSGALRDTSHTIDVIFLYQNGVRLSARVVQKKVTTATRLLLTHYQDTWVPLKRTVSTEECVRFSKQPVLVEKSIHRVIVQQSDGIRVSYNKEVSGLGEKYTIDYEIEYAANSAYCDILRAERKLIRVFVASNHQITRDVMTRIDMFSCVMSKVQMWHCFDPDKTYLWAYKWNGIKAKILITSNESDDGSLITYVWTDDSKISNKLCRGNNIQHLVNICCAVEILDDRIIIIEAIGTMVSGDIYTTEPMANAAFLKYLSTLLRDDVTIDGVPLLVQHFYEPSLPGEYGKDCDGFIIIQDDLIIKWKIPTIDVKCIAAHTYKVGSQIIQLAFKGEPGKIYEISNKNEVLRQRVDRLAASSDQEYAVFLDSAKMLQL